MTTSRRSGYKSFPELEPYTSKDRYGEPKEDFKTIGRELGKLVDPHRVYEVADLGCGNGALLSYLRQQHPPWKLSGYDFTGEYIETAQSFVGLKGVKFFQEDFLRLKGRFDLVLSTCLLSIFKDIQKPLKKMLSLCRNLNFRFLVLFVYRERHSVYSFEFQRTNIIIGQYGKKSKLGKGVSFPGS